MANFIQSDYINMYPSALRGGTDANENTVVYNPESRLNSEFNITNPVNRLTIDGSFVIKYAENAIEFSIHGYYFKIENVTNSLKTLPDGNVWASIKLVQLSQSSDYKLWSLSSWESTTNLDRQKSGSTVFEFTGLDLSSTKKTGTNVYSLLILKKSGNNYTVPEASLLRFDPDHVKIEGEKSLHDVIYNENSKLTISVDEFKGHLTGNVKGDLDGNAKTSTDSSYAAKIGTSTSHPQIGGPLKPVYVDSNGVIKQFEESKGGYRNATFQTVYLAGGEIKPGVTINVNNRAPVDGSDAGSEGDIWFQYVG